ncbi:fimbria/pilus outer membrane usher protein [Salmonella enterica]|uniref:Fimbria/pilus outer membrane usher protein n=1 Tax=Salmonella enterica TaxID=28901 RepID=A0A628V8T0_SALER|nr:fimbria/pilus outer membrane usher protein [Salmonella enterica]EEC6702094.1 fimbria/pilus outer membrane usher protein [Salmonella enterica]ELF5202352.1 fimbria/pilus outer membrane usher protein [Salmonella enterica]
MKVRNQWGKCRYSGVLVFFLLTRPGLARTTWHFDQSMVGGAAADVSLLEAGRQLPGTYHVTVKVNGNVVDSKDIVFRQIKDERTILQTGLQPCLKVEQLALYGIRTEDYFSDVDGVKDTSLDGPCVSLSRIPRAAVTFNFYEQTLELSIPQAALRPQDRTIASETLWNDGIPALLANYDASESRSVNRKAGRRSNSSYFQLRPGINLGAWRLRNVTSWQRSSGGRGRWQSVYTRLEWNLYKLKSRLFLGEESTSSDMFDSVSIRGGMLSSDESMIPWRERGFSPTVRGSARTQARIEVRQQGYLVYSTTVAPGPFALSDLPARTGGDLDVTVKESDGSEQHFQVPYGMPAIALKDGHLRYQVAAGEYRSADRSVERVPVWHASAMYGLPLNLTLQGGMQGGTHYRAVAAGVGSLLGHVGAVSLDTLQSSGEIPTAGRSRGAMWRLRYSRTLETTGTGVYLSAQQYTSSQYRTMSDVLDMWHRKQNSAGRLSPYDHGQRPRNRLTLTLNQFVGWLGYLNVSAMREAYRSHGGHGDSLSVGYSVSLPWNVSLSLNLSQSTSPNANTNRQVGGMLSIPLDNLLHPGCGATWQMTSSSGRITQEEGLYGRAFNQQLFWSARQSDAVGTGPREDSRHSLYMNLPGTYGQVGGSYSYSRMSQQMTANASGGMVLHRHGLTLSQSLSDSVALIEAPGAGGVSVGNWTGVKTDFRGYTVLSRLTPYQQNRISLDPSTLPSDAAIEHTNVVVVATEGAVVPARFVTSLGKKSLVTLSFPDGKTLPFGAIVRLVQDSGREEQTGIVGDGGAVYLTGLPDKGRLSAQWGHHAEQMCYANYLFPATEEKTGGVYSLAAICRQR